MMAITSDQGLLEAKREKPCKEGVCEASLGFPG